MKLSGVHMQSHIYWKVFCEHKTHDTK